MRIVVLGGAGIIGRAIVRDLVTDVDQVRVADLDEDAAREVAEKAGSGVSAHRVDVTDAGALEKVLEGSQACINAVQYYYNLDVMAACLRAGIPYVDLGGLFHTTRKQLALADEFRQAGVTAVLGMGSCPGVANVQAGFLAARLDQVESVRIYNGSTQDEGESLSWAYSIDTILDEISQPAMVFREGIFQERPPLSEEEFYLFPEPIGYAKTHLSLHSEIATLPLSLADKGLRECSFKITFFGYSEAALRKMQFLAEIGMARKEPIEVRGQWISPRAVLIEVLKQALVDQPASRNPGFKDIATEVKGRQEGQDIHLRVDTSAWPHKRWGLSGGKLLVASPPAITARWLADRTLNQPGVWAPEQIIPGELFFSALAQRGAVTALTQKTRLVG